MARAERITSDDAIDTEHEPARFRTVCPARVRLQVAVPERLQGNVETVAYRLLQECYHNIARHAAASQT